MSWYAQATGAYADNSAEAEANVREMSALWSQWGYHTRAQAAMLGNCYGEGGLNPWRWESDQVLTVAQFQALTPADEMQHGYGLFGFTPARTYINSANASLPGYGPNFADQTGLAEDGEAQLYYLDSTVEQNWSHGLYNYYYSAFAGVGIDINDFYWMTFEDFKAGNDSIFNLTGAFCLCYEKPSNGNPSGLYGRALEAEYFYGTGWLREPFPWLIIYSQQNRRRWRFK